MIVVVALLVWAGVHNRQERRARVMLMEQKSVAAANAANAKMPEADAAMPDQQGSNLIGQAAPAFTLTDLSGNKVSLADFKGKPVVVNFWATWCGPCKLEMPWFEEFYGKYKSQGLVVLGLSQDDDTPKATIAAAAKKIGVSYPILLPDDAVAKKYGGVDYLPETFYVAKDGKVVVTTAGAPSKDEMEANIQKTIAAGGD
jgi:thiol-disulfide isomerase/thioredoxin